MGEQGAESGRTLDDLLAQRFHDLYEHLAPQYGYTTRRESAVPWAEVPEHNKSLMRAVVSELRRQGYVCAPFPPSLPPGSTARP